MNEKIMRKAGFGEEVDRVKEGKCPLCGKEIGTIFAFRDKLSLREFAISGLCQECQDKAFGATHTDYWKGCCLKTKRSLVDKYCDQFATFVEDRGRTVVIKVAGKEIEISKQQFKEDWIMD